MPTKIKVISLERSSDRRKTFIQQNPDLDFEFINAVDGSGLSPADIKATMVFTDDLPYSKGAYGCALSHVALWQAVIENQEAMTIAEDDAIFRADFPCQYEQCLKAVPDNWDIILWGWNFDSILSLDEMPGISPAVMIFNQTNLRENIKNFKSLVTQVKLLKLDKCFGLPAYTISPQGAQKFINMCTPFENFNLYFPVLNRHLPNNGIDIALNKVYAESRAFVTFPPLVITKNEHDSSTIQNCE